MDTLSLILIISIFALLIALLLGAVKWGSTDLMIAAIAFVIFVAIGTMYTASQIEPAEQSTEEAKRAIVQNHETHYLSQEHWLASI